MTEFQRLLALHIETSHRAYPDPVQRMGLIRLDTYAAALAVKIAPISRLFELIVAHVLHYTYGDAADPKR
jgi:hypothetical protein